MHDGDAHAATDQGVRRLQAQQTAANDDSTLVLPGGCQHGIDVGEIAESHDTREADAGDRQHDRTRSGRQEQPIVRCFDPAPRAHDPLAAVDRDDCVTGVQADVPFLVPLDRVSDDLLVPLLAGEQRREEDPVVVAVRLGTEHFDVIRVWRQFQQLLDRAHASHSVADHDQAPTPWARDLLWLGVHPDPAVQHTGGIDVDRVCRVLDAAPCREAEVVLVDR